jgi:hypothetical protein
MTKVGQFTVSQLSAAQTVAAQIAVSSQSDGDIAGVVPWIRQGTIISKDATVPPTCTVTFDGVTNVPGIGYVTSFVPAAGDVVNCFVLGGTTWITEKLATAARGINSWSGTRNAQTLVLNAAWTTMGAFVAHPAQQDDGVLFSGSDFTAPVDGRYLLTALVSFGTATSGVFYARWVATTGTVLSFSQASAGVNPVETVGVFYGVAGASAHVEVRQDTGGSVLMPAHAAGTPQHFSFTLLG